MKLNVTQAEILATEVQKQITEKALAKKDAALEKQIKEACFKINKQLEKIKVAEKIVDGLKEERKETIKKINENFKLGIYQYLSVPLDEEAEIKKYKSAQVPSTQEIKNKIVMKSLFGSEQEMQEFLQALISEYTD